MMASQASIQILAFATSIVVARFLAPRQVGLAAEALVFSSLALVAVDFGFASVLVQRPQLSEEDKSTAFWMGTLLGFLMTLLGIGLSWPIASLYGEPEVQSLFAVLSLVFVFTAPGIVQGALLTRDLKFRSLEVRTIIATTVSCATAMVLAVAGVGAWAIIAQHLTITSVSTLLLWRSSSWRLRNEDPGLGERQPGQPPHRALPRHRVPGCVRARVQRDGDADQACRDPDHPGLLPGVLAHGRPRAHRRRLAPRDPHGRAGRRPTDARPDRRGP